jgi:hypothetical protein
VFYKYSLHVDFIDIEKLAEFLFLFIHLCNGAFSSSVCIYILLNDGVTDEYPVGKDVDGSRCGLI